MTGIKTLRSRVLPLSAPSGSVKVAVVTTHIAPAVGFGGIAESIGRVVHAWAERGRDFAVCSSAASHGPELCPDDLGLPPRMQILLYRVRRWRRFAFGLSAIPAILATCRRADVVYINGIATWPTTLAALTCVLLGRPMLVALRGGLMAPHLAVIRARKPLKWLFYQLLTLPTLRRARCLHLTSPLEAEGLTALLPHVPVVIIPNGLDMTQWPVCAPRPALHAREKGKDDGLTLCYVGRLSVEKGILRFLRVWSRVRGAHDRLIITGSGAGAYAEAVMHEARALGAAVELTGTIDRAGVQRVLARSDFLVLPSGIEEGDLRENFGNAAAEALASARPILVTRGLAWDEAEPEGFGVLFDPADAAITAALTRVQALSPDERVAMGHRGRAYAERTLDIRATTERLWTRLVTLF